MYRSAGVYIIEVLRGLAIMLAPFWILLAFFVSGFATDTAENSTQALMMFGGTFLVLSSPAFAILFFVGRGYWKGLSKANERASGPDEQKGEDNED